MPGIKDDPQQKEEVKQIVQEVMEEQRSGEQGGGGEQEKIQKAIVDCTNAYNLCVQSMNYALSQGGKFVEPENFNKFLDCAELCQITANLLLRESEQKAEVAKMCSKACEECVKVCDQFSEDPQMQACKEYVQKCADSVKEIK